MCLGSQTEMSEHHEKDHIFPNIFSQKTINEVREEIVNEDSPLLMCNCCYQDGTGTEESDSLHEETESETKKGVSIYYKNKVTTVIKFYIEECIYVPFAYIISFSLLRMVVPIHLNILISISFCFSTILIKFKRKQNSNMKNRI